MAIIFLVGGPLFWTALFVRNFSLYSEHYFANHFATEQVTDRKNQPIVFDRPWTFQSSLEVSFNRSFSAAISTFISTIIFARSFSHSSSLWA